MLEKGRSREEEEEEKQGDRGHQIEDADNIKIRCSKVRTNKRLLKTQFCFKLYKLPSLAWHPKEAARLLENGRNREKEEEEKQGDGGHRTKDADDLEICCSKVQTNKRLFRTQFRFKLCKLQSLGWPPKEAAGSLEKGRSREEEEEEGKQGDGGHRTEDADNLEICCSKVQANKQTSEFSNFALNSTSYHH